MSEKPLVLHTIDGCLEGARRNLIRANKISNKVFSEYMGNTNMCHVLIALIERILDNDIDIEKLEEAKNKKINEDKSPSLYEELIDLFLEFKNK